MEKRDLSVEAFLSNKVAVGVLRALIKRDMPLAISRIAKDIRSNYCTVRRHARFLEKAGLVILVDYGKRKLCKTNTADGRVMAFKTFIESWNNLEKRE